MSVTFMGIKPGVGPVLKVMANRSDSPLTTPNGDVEKFLFNSEDRDYCYIKRVIRVESSDSRWGQFGGLVLEQSVLITGADFLNDSNYYDIVYVDYATGFQQERGWFKYQSSPARYRSRFDIHTSHFIVPANMDIGDGQYPYDRFYRTVSITDFAGVRFTPGYFLIVEWNLPIGQWARPRLPPAVSTTGQRVLEFSASRCALAAPGYDVRFASDDQTIFSDTRRVVGCIASGEITLSGTYGAVSIPAIPGANYFVDLQWNEPGQPRRVPYFREGSADISVRAKVSGSTLEFASAASNVTITYHVYAYGHGPIDITSPLRIQTHDQGIMIWRGPAAGPVSYNNIIFDSRIRYPRVVSDQLFQALNWGEYWGPSSFNFASRGYTPIIKVAAFGPYAGGSLTMTRYVQMPFYDNVGAGIGLGCLISPNSLSFGTPSISSGWTFSSWAPSATNSLGQTFLYPDNIRGRGVRMYALSI